MLVRTVGDGFAESLETKADVETIPSDALNMPSDFLEVRQLQETSDGTFKVVLPLKSVSFTQAQNKTKNSTLHTMSTMEQPYQSCLPRRPCQLRTPLEKAFLFELEKKLKPQKNKVDQQIEERSLARLRASRNSPLVVIPIVPQVKVTPIVTQNPRTVMDELKQRLNKIYVSSNFCIDRIVKESKTTTITESREIIHFRPEEEKLVKVNLPETTPPKRLSIKSIPDTVIETKVQSEPSHTYVNISESKPKKSSISSDNKDTLLGEYVRLEEDIKDINKKNKELREKFFYEGETPILKERKETTLKSTYRSQSPSVTGRLSTKNFSSQPGSSGQMETKTTGCGFNLLK